MILRYLRQSDHKKIRPHDPTKSMMKLATK